MTTVIAWHITGSHKALGGLCVCRGAGGEEAQPLCGSFVRNLSLVDPVANDTISILVTAAASDQDVVV